MEKLSIKNNTDFTLKDLDAWMALGYEAIVMTRQTVITK